MPLTLILEDGTGKADANSYASVAEGNAYHDAHLYSDAWTTANDARKAVALVMATRSLNAAVEWFGMRGGALQALEWPRYGVERKDVGDIGATWPENAVPVPVKNATCELARELLSANRTADADTRGIAELGLGQGAISIKFDASDRAGVLPDEVLRLIVGLGRARGSKSATVKVRRV